MGETVIGHLRQCPQVKHITACDTSQTRLTELRQKHDVSVTNTLSDVLEDESIELVFVTASNDAHKDLTLKAIGAGKAVMCEKPMATCLADALQMCDIAEKNNAFLQIGFELRYSRLYTTVKDWIDAGLLGDVVNVSCNYICSEFHGRSSWRNKKSTSGSMFGEKLSHYVDLPRWWIGDEVTEVYSACAPNAVPYFEVHDNYHTTCKFRNGAISHLTFMMAPAASFNGDPLQNTVDQQNGDGHQLTYLVQGSKGAAATDVFNRTIKRWEFSDSPKGLISTWVENLTWEPQEDSSYFHSTFEQTVDIVDRVAKGLPPKTSARDAFETMRVCHAAEESADNGQAVKLEQKL